MFSGEGADAEPGLPTLHLTLSHIPSEHSSSPVRSSESHTAQTMGVSNRSDRWWADFCSTVSVLNPIFYMLRAKNNTCCGVGENSTLLSGFSLTASSTFWRLRSLFLPVCSLCYYFWRWEIAPLRLQTEVGFLRKWPVLLLVGEGGSSSRHLLAPCSAQGHHVLSRSNCKTEDCPLCRQIGKGDVRLLNNHIE